SSTKRHPQCFIAVIDPSWEPSALGPTAGPPERGDLRRESLPPHPASGMPDPMRRSDGRITHRSRQAQVHLVHPPWTIVDRAHASGRLLPSIRGLFFALG